METGVDLEELVGHVVAAMPQLDAAAVAGPGARYPPGVGTMTEPQFCAALKGHLAGHLVQAQERMSVQEPYPGQGRMKCDICIGPANAVFEWAVEFKKIAFVGNNGGKNDFGPSKIVSPYPIHGSSVRDANRLMRNRSGRHAGVLMYIFELDDAVVQAGRALCQQQGIALDQVEKMAATLHDNGGNYYAEPSFEMFQAVSTPFGFRLGRRFQAPFGPLTRHPLFLKGQVAAWEILNP